MDAYKIQDSPGVDALVCAVQQNDEPLVVYDGEDECMVAMRPSVFERILFDTSLLNAVDRETLHL